MNGIEFCRAKSGLTQQQVGAILGINQSTICKWEQGKSLPRAKTLPRLSSLYRCSTDELLRRRISQEELDSIKPKKKK